jgi:hypothetical protein
MILYLVIGLIFALLIDMVAGVVRFSPIEKLMLIVGWPFFLLVGIDEMIRNARK